MCFLRVRVPTVSFPLPRTSFRRTTSISTCRLNEACQQSRGAIGIRGIGGAAPAFDSRHQPGATRESTPPPLAKRDAALLQRLPAFTFINEIQSIGNSNYNSLQATLRVSDLHGFSSQVAYTWSHSFDEVTAYRGALPQNSTNFSGDYGSSDFDARHIFVGLVSYSVPGSDKFHLLTKGWQLNSLLTFHSGNPFSVFSSGDTSGTNEMYKGLILCPE